MKHIKTLFAIVVFGVLIVAAWIVMKNEQDTSENFPLIGYHTTVELDNYGSLADCDAMVVTGGAREERNYYLSLMNNEGRFGYSKTDEGLLVLNLDLSQVNEEQASQIMSATPDAPVTVTLERKPESEFGQGAPACYSFVQIIDVE